MPGYLLDSEAFAELVAAEPDSSKSPVVQWTKSLPDLPYVSQLTWGFVRSEVERPSAQLSPRAREEWRHKLDRQVPQDFGARLLPILIPHLQRWSEVRWETFPSGAAPSDVVAMELAVCFVEDLTYVTNRAADFASLPGLKSFSPWN